MRPIVLDIAIMIPLNLGNLSLWMQDIFCTQNDLNCLDTSFKNDTDLKTIFSLF